MCEAWRPAAFTAVEAVVDHLPGQRALFGVPEVVADQVDSADSRCQPCRRRNDGVLIAAAPEGGAAAGTLRIFESVGLKPPSSCGSRMWS